MTCDKQCPHRGAKVEFLYIVSATGVKDNPDIDVNRIIFVHGMPGVVVAAHAVVVAVLGRHADKSTSLVTSKNVFHLLEELFIS